MYSVLFFPLQVQVYQQALRCMVSYDEKKYSSACIEPPVPKCYLGQLDAQNDVLVLEDLGQTGYRKYSGSPSTAAPGLNSRYLSDIDHCRVVLRRLAHFHAFSTLIQRDSGELLLDLFPFAVDAMVFREQFQCRVATVKAELVRYLVCNKGMVSDADEAAEKVERHLQDLFWRLVELRAQPQNIPRWKSVLAHGAVDLRNIVFQYDETSGRPISAKFLDFSSMTVSSPVIDISYFLHSSVNIIHTCLLCSMYSLKDYYLVLWQIALPKTWVSYIVGWNQFLSTKIPAQNPKFMFFVDTYYNIKVNDNVLYKTGLASITISSPSSSSRSFPRLPLIIIPHYSRFTTGPIWRPSNPSGCTATKWSLKTYLPSIMLNKTMVL